MEWDDLPDPMENEGDTQLVELLQISEPDKPSHVTCLLCLFAVSLKMGSAVLLQYCS